MRIYPDRPGARLRTLLRDAAVLFLLILFAWIGVKVHDAVDALAVLGQGVQDTGNAVQSGFEAAADAVDDIPLVGGAVADGLEEAGEGSGGNVAELGEEGEEGVHQLANLLGFLTFALPAALLLVLALPARIAQVRRMRDAAKVLERPASPDLTRAVAMRAAFSLPYGRLLEYTRDPLGDLAAERYQPLVEAAFDDAGLRSPELPTASSPR